MQPRFYLPDLDPDTGHGTLVNDEASHLTRVLRLGPGAAIDVFDGRGHMYDARVVGVSRDLVSVQVVAPKTPAAEAAVRVDLVTGVLKGDKMDTVVRDTTMMGVAAIQPVVTTRAETTVAALERGHRLERWERIAISSAKQCGRAVVPDILPAVTIDAWLDRNQTGTRLGLFEPSAAMGVRLSSLAPAARVALIVGPEGGWAPDETGRLTAAGVIAVTLGPRTLRAETAPTVALAALFETWAGW